MDLKQAKGIAEEIVKHLEPYCRRIEVAGSIRRKKKFVRDIDLVIIPKDAWNLMTQLRKLGQVTASGAKLIRIITSAVQIDVYLTDEKQWATLLLIRTGSKEHNVKLCTLAKNKGWRLAASGEGLFDKYGKRIAGDTEESIFEALGVPFVPPEKRD